MTSPRFASLLGSVFGTAKRGVAPPCALLLCGAAAIAGQHEYDFFLVEPFNATGSVREAYVWDINNDNLAVGTATTASAYQGFYWTVEGGRSLAPATFPRAVNNAGDFVDLNKKFLLGAGTLVTLAPPPSTFPLVRTTDINDAGVVVGYAVCNCPNADGTSQTAAYWAPDGTPHALDVPGARELVAVNGAGVAAGNVSFGQLDSRAFVLDLGTGEATNLHDLLSPGGQGVSFAADVASNGLVAGHGFNGAAHRAFVWTPGEGFVFLGALGGGPAHSVVPIGVNASGVVVGEAANAQGQWRAFVWDATNGTRDLGSLAALPEGFVLDDAMAINDNGWIVGYGHFGANLMDRRGFVLRPRGAQPCPGDTNGDGVVGFADFSVVLANYGQATSNGDVTGDGVVDFEDFSAVLANYGLTCE